MIEIRRSRNLTSRGLKHSPDGSCRNLHARVKSSTSRTCYTKGILFYVSLWKNIGYQVVLLWE